MRFCGDILVVIFANKVDLVDESKLDHTEIQNIVKDNNFLGYYITSVKTVQGVWEVFNDIIDDLYVKYK